MVVASTEHKPSKDELLEYEKRLAKARVLEESIQRHLIDGRSLVWYPQDGSQTSFLQCPYFEVLYHGTRGPGKSLKYNDKILTEDGWKQVEDVSFSDRLVAPDGSYTNILGIFPHKNRPMNKVTFDDGAVVMADDKHRWSVYDSKNQKWHVENTKQIAENIEKGICRRHVPLISNPIPGKKWKGYDPYAIGLILGDGTMGSKNPTVYSPDPEVAEYLSSLGWTPKDYSRPGKVMQIYLTEGRGGHDALVGSISKDTSHSKHVDKVLIDADPKSRLAVLQGLMDTDGHCDKDGRCEFKSMSHQLAKDVQYLVRSLGGKAKVSKQEFSADQISKRYGDSDHIYRVKITHAGKFSPFRLERKRDRLNGKQHGCRRRIESIEPAVSADAVCFSVEHPSHLFVCNDFVVTHNTDALLWAFAQHVGKGYGAAWAGIIFRQTYPQLADIQAKSEKWFKQIFPDAKFNRSKMTWEWPTGERLLFRHMARPQDYWNYHGHEYPFIGFEELTNWATSDCYTSMFACCRCSTPGVPRMVRATTNPYGPGHHWVKGRFKLTGQWWKTVIQDKPKDIEGRIEPARVAIHGHIDENKILLAADPNYKSTIIASASNKAMAAAWLSGSWDIIAGGMFGDVWKPKYNIVPRFDIPEDWRIDRSFDWGSSKPFSVGWWAESDGSDVLIPNRGWISTVRGDLFRVNEWYGWSGKPNEGVHMLATEIAEGIVERELAYGYRQVKNGQQLSRVRPGPADSSIYDVENGVCLGEDMQKPVRIGGMVHPGVTWTRADKRKGSRVAGWELLRMYMKNAHPTGKGPREKPGLFCVEHCEQFVRTVPSLPRDDIYMDDVDTDAEDHAGDEARYRVRGRNMRVGSGTTVGLY